jgi:2-oxo-3-hexenedioate decarboxylase
MEIIDSRYADFRFSLAAVVADNTSGCGFVLGPASRVPATLDNLGMVLHQFDGRARQLGSSAASPGQPHARALHAAWRLARRHGLKVGAGSVLLAGAATAAETLPAGGHVQAEVAGLGRVSFRVGGGRADECRRAAGSRGPRGPRPPCRPPAARSRSCAAAGSGRGAARDLAARRAGHGRVLGAGSCWPSAAGARWQR